MQFTIYEAKTQLSKLIAAAERDENVVIRDEPVVRIVAERPEIPRRVLGFLASNEVKLDGFLNPVLDEQIAEDFLLCAAPDPLHPDQPSNDDHDQVA